MPIYIKKNRKKVFHIHIPKTGGSSVSKIFSNNGWSQEEAFSVSSGRQHALKEEWERSVGKDVEKFTIIREPLQRIISEIRGDYTVYQDIIKPWNIDGCISHMLKHETHKENNHLRKIIDFIDINKLDEQNITVFRYEENWTNRLKQKLNLIGEFPRVVGASYWTDMDATVSDKSISLVKEYYIEDYNAFYPHL